MKKQRETEREEKIKEIFKQYRITAKSIEGKGATAFIPDILCWDEEGNTFFIELKDGSDFSTGQKYLLKRLKNTFSCEYEEGNFIFKNHKATIPYIITLSQLLDNIK